MDAKISSLGLGSGVLTNNVLDAYVSSFELTSINPIEKDLNKEELNKKIEEKYIEKLKEIKSSSAEFGNDAYFLKRKAIYNDNYFDIKVEKGVKEQNFDLEVIQLAKKDINESKNFSSKDSALDIDDELNLEINEKNYNIKINKNDSLENIKDKINESTNGEIIASIMKVDNNNYKLIVKSDKEGAENKINFNYKNDDFLDINKLQEAQNSIIKFNEVQIERNGNNINDIIVGVDFKLKDIGKSNVSIIADNDNFKEDLEKFIDDFNSLDKNNRDLKYKLMDLEIFDFNKDGQISLNKDYNKIDKEKFTKTFKEFNDILDNKIKINNENYDKLKERIEKLENEKIKMRELVDKRIKQLKLQFMQYDKMIASFNNNYGALQMSIDAMLKNK